MKPDQLLWKVSLALAVSVSALAFVHTAHIFFHWFALETALTLSAQLLAALVMRAMVFLRVRGQAVQEASPRTPRRISKRVLNTILYALSLGIPALLYTISFCLQWRERGADHMDCVMICVTSGMNILSLLITEGLLYVTDALLADGEPPISAAE